MSVHQLLNTLSSHEISEWMAYDMTNNPEYIRRYNEEEDRKRFESLSVEGKTNEFKRLFKRIGA